MNERNFIQKKNKNSGFTIMELIIVIAIIAILGTVSALCAVNIKRNIQQKELDSKAELIYMAAQNRMTKLKELGKNESFCEYLTPLGIVPSDAGDTVSEDTLYYADSIYKNDEINNSVAQILPQSYIDRTLWNQNWVIELDPVAGSIYAVFYSEEPMNYVPEAFDGLRDMGERKKSRTVGYYGGKTVARSNSVKRLQPSIQVVNGETLTALLVCNSPDGGNLTFNITLEDEDGNKEEITPLLIKTGKRFRHELVLDDLSEEKTRFHNAFPSLTPGSDITITLEVQSDSLLIDSKSTTAAVNSLFADKEDDTAIITYGRHLQNLDADSGVTEKIKKASQQSDIQFKENKYDSENWNGYYGENAFKPIDNEHLTEYNGSFVNNDADVYTSICGLSISEASAIGGVFAKFYNGTISNVSVTGSEISASDKAGALVGSIEGNVTLNNCKAYLNPARGETRGKSETDPCVMAKTVGGLVGTVPSGSKLTMDSCFAANVLGVSDRTDYAGGLIGELDGTAEINRCYTDSYIYGKNTGGFIAELSDSAEFSFSNCYTVGCQTAKERAAGFAPGKVLNAENAYTAVEMSGAKKTYSTVQSGKLNNVYYLRGFTDAEGTEEISYDELKERTILAHKLGEQFTDETGGTNTVAYNLKQQGLTDYTFPKLVGLKHYGDWNAKFEFGTLVYYEKYADGAIGFYGANTTTLKNSRVVVGDGYGIVYDRKPSFDVRISYEQGSSENTEIIKQTDALAIANGYYLMPLTKEISDVGYESEKFYQKIVVKIENENTYYYNPHLAKNMTRIDECPEEAPYMMYVRSARQLYDLSKYYSKYADITKRSTFYQENDIDYELYDFENYSIADEVHRQGPIGKDNENPFNAIYDGGCYKITNVSFMSNGRYSGMFGYNEGTLLNLVIASDYVSGSEQTAGTTATIQGSSEKAAIGVLAGANYGRIENSAAAGYSMNIYMSLNGTAYVGGLVGANYGSVRNSQSSTPYISLETNYSYAYAGGFAGYNQGDIDRCYCISDIQVTSAKSGQVNISGFTGDNPGVIRRSYSTTSLTAAGSAVSYGFAPKGGYVTDCCYLNGGTYFYVNQIHPYVFDKENTDGDAKSNIQMKEMTVSEFGKAETSENHVNTSGEYPYPAVVTDSENKFVHYGDWVGATDMGKFGMFYWEHETEGSNNGYHFSFLGVDVNTNCCKAASALCESHNDGGIVSEFGYGYYVQQDKENLISLASTEGFADMGSVNSTASEQLEEQMDNYKFYAYNSGKSGSSHLYLNTESANGYWNLKYNGVNYKYEVSPFFADSMSLTSQGGLSVMGELKENKNYMYSPGSEQNHYLVRSAKQLQYINWNYEGQNISTDVTSSNYKTFPYLNYATVTKSGSTQSYADAKSKRPIKHWDQTHDLDDKNEEFTPIAGTKITATKSNNEVLYAWFGGSLNGKNYSVKNIQITDSKLVNIGVFGTTVGARLENIVLYSDRNSKIRRKTERTDTAGTYVIGGLVGIAYEYVGDPSRTTREEITNCAIAGYTIEDRSKNELGITGVNIGGLVGVSNVDLNNCSAVVDIDVNCTHLDKNGDIVSYGAGNNIRVGGIAGACKFSMKNCYSGGNIKVGADLLKESGDYGGGLSTDERDGNVKDTREIWDGKGNILWQNRCSTKYSSHVFIGGLGGSAFSSNYVNFNGGQEKADASPAYYNCYTYMNFPKIEGTIRTVSIIGSVADRFRYVSRPMVIDNCYFLDSIVDNLNKDSVPKYYFRLMSGKTDYKDLNLNNILSGDIGEVLNDYLGFNGFLSFLFTSGRDYESPQINGLTPLTYSEMASRNGIEGGNLKKYTNWYSSKTKTSGTYSDFAKALNGGDKEHGSYSWVTVEECGAYVNGKYSFPGSARALTGKDYPFPTILTQPNSFGDTVNIHYGEWPMNGLYWADGMVTMDMIMDYDESVEKSLIALKLKVTDELYNSGGKTNPKFTVTDDFGAVSSEVVKIDKCTYNAAEKCYDVIVEGLDVGTARVAATLGDTVAEFLIDVTAIINVKADPMDLLIYSGHESITDITVKSAERANASLDLTDDPQCKLTVVSDDNNITEVSKTEYDVRTAVKHVTLTGISEGEAKIKVEAKYTLSNGKSFKGSVTVVTTVASASIIGAANIRITPKRYNEIEIPQVISEKSYKGTDIKYSETQVSPTNDDGEFFVYAAGSSMQLKEYNIKNISVTDAGGTTSKIISDGAKMSGIAYDVVIRNVTSDRNYQYIPMTIIGGKDEPVIAKIMLEKDGVTYEVEVNTNVISKQVTATFQNSDGTVIGTQSVPYGGIADLKAVDFSKLTPPMPQEGYKNTEPSAEESWSPDVTEKMFDDVTYIYTPKQNPIHYYVKFNPPDGDVQGVPVLQPFIYDEAQNLRKNTFVKDGYSFIGWATENGGTARYKDGELVTNLSSKEDDEVNLFTVWQELLKYHISFDANGGVHKDGSGKHMANMTNIPFDATVALSPNEYVRTHWAFSGWSRIPYPDYDENAKAEFADKAQVKGLTNVNGETVPLYAVWKLVNGVHINFDMNGGDAFGPWYREQGTQIAVPKNEDVHYTGHKLDEWVSGTGYRAAHYKPGTALTLGTSDITLKASWSKLEYNVTHNRGSDVSFNSLYKNSSTVLYGEEYNAGYRVSSLRKDFDVVVTIDGKTATKGVEYTVRQTDLVGLYYEVVIKAEYVTGPIVINTTLK